MKINKLWFVIIMILVIGTLATRYTKQCRDQGIYVQTEAVQAEAAQEESVQESAVQKKAVQDDSTAQTEAVSVMARKALPAPETEEKDRTNGYLNRLKDLDARIEKEHASLTDTTNSLKAAAEQERKLWEAELNRILSALKERLPDEERNALFKEQKAWIRDRESIAVESSKKKNGSSLEEVEYNVSLADTTRERAYELAEQYASVLTGAE